MSPSHLKPLLRLSIRYEQDVVAVRQRARQIAEIVGFATQEQTRISTAVSEVARNAFQYAGGGVAEFLLDTDCERPCFFVRVTDKGPGIPHLQTVLDGDYVSRTGMGLGLVGARRLMDEFEIETSSSGTSVFLGKRSERPAPSKPLSPERIATQLMGEKPKTAFDEIQKQNQELLNALDELQVRQDQLSQLNEELADTNRGVVALYAELDEKAASLQRANETKTRFLSMMTHEFRTPLTSIISLTRLLLDRIDGELTSEQEKQVKFIRQSGENLLELVNDLLDIAKVEAGKVSIEPGEFEVHSLLGTLRGMFKPLIPQDRDVELSFELALDFPHLYTDEAKLSQILRNLIGNAIKFTESGRIEVSAALEGDYVCFQVSDTGIGIPENSFNHIFEEFVQVDSDLQRKHKGTGLGLPLSRKLARLLGGDLTVESKLGEGTTFFLRVPRMLSGRSEGSIVDTERARDTASAEALAPRVLRRVLLVDDDVASRYVIKTLIAKEIDVAFLEASDGSEGLRLAREEKPHAIVLDLTMPGLSGLDVLRALKSDTETFDIPVIINTAKILGEDESDMLSQLAVMILSKDHSDSKNSTFRLRNALHGAGLLNLSTESNSREESSAHA